MLRVAAPPPGWIPPAIPFRRAAFVDKEQVKWNVREDGAAAIVFSVVKHGTRVVIASKLSPDTFYDTKTGIWAARCETDVLNESMPIASFVEKNRQRPWGKRDRYGFKKRAFAQKSANMTMAGARAAFKQPFYNIRNCLFNERAFREKIKARTAQLCPLPYPGMSLPVLSNHKVAGDGLVDWAIAQHLPTLRALVAARKCIIAAGKVNLLDLTEPAKIAALGELVWWAHFEPYRAAMAEEAHKDGTQRPGKRTRGVPIECIDEARALATRLKRAKKLADDAAAKQSAGVLPKCMLKADSRFDVKQRCQLAAVLKKAGSSISHELALELAGSNPKRAEEFQNYVKFFDTKWNERKAPVISCSRKHCRGECPFNGNTAACALDITARATGKVADIEDMLCPKHIVAFASPVDAVKHGIALRAS